MTVEQDGLSTEQVLLVRDEENCDARVSYLFLLLRIMNDLKGLGMGKLCSIFLEELIAHMYIQMHGASNKGLPIFQSQVVTWGPHVYRKDNMYIVHQYSLSQVLVCFSIIMRSW
ncbi:hypothetical protein DD599_26885 [Enterobacter cloacae complex sp. CH23B]|nr:hypothetical protein DD599_26885 [Enterobacter cloacae complex sp. CH23B]